ncbi:MAG: RNA polymerase sigma factor [Actinomycetota bacterium]|nr:RNA polymerase sigma factor [Actinomycetota bacterium]
MYCGNIDVAEELAQETLMRVVRDWRKVQKMESPEAWAHRVALNLANSLFRRRVAEARAKERIAGQPRRSVPPPSARDIAVRQAVTTLPRRQKTALMLRYFAGLSVRETAEVMQCPQGTVKTLTFQAVATLRDLPQTQGLQEAHDGG